MLSCSFKEVFKYTEYFNCISCFLVIFLFVII